MTISYESVVTLLSTYIFLQLQKMKQFVGHKIFLAKIYVLLLIFHYNPSKTVRNLRRTISTHAWSALFNNLLGFTR